MRTGEESYAEPSKLNSYLRWTGHGDLFSNCALKLLPKVSNAPIPANNRPGARILNAEATTKCPFRGCLRLKFQASLTFHKNSSYAAFEKRPPCPSFNLLFMKCKACPPSGRRAWGSSKGRIFPHLAPCALHLAPCTLRLNIDADLRRVP
jgi:hypothetical protein